LNLECFKIDNSRMKTQYSRHVNREVTMDYDIIES
jgi:hypothetical protein